MPAPARSSRAQPCRMRAARGPGAVDASASGRLDRVLIALLALLALASFEAVTPLSAAARELSSTLSAGRRVLELTDQDPLIHEPRDPFPAPAWPFEIALEDVTARYPRGARPVFEDLTLCLDPGERIALVGPSGAGKTTIVNLLLLGIALMYITVFRDGQL